MTVRVTHQQTNAHQWTMPRPGPLGTTQADIYWMVSTWDPYQTVLLRSRIRP